jgi:hypothetical protein
MATATQPQTLSTIGTRSVGVGASARGLLSYMRQNK